MSQLFEPERPSSRRALPAEPLSGVLPKLDEAGAEAARANAARASWLSRFAKNLAVQDGLIVVYFLLMLGALALGTGPGRAECLQRVALDMLFIGVGLVLTRGSILKPGSLAHGLTYRFTLFLGVFLSYFQLREILPAVSPRAIDGDIFAFDLRVFGVEPSLAWDRFVTPHTTEWFAFFYFGYFFILIGHVMPMMFNASNRTRLAHFALGIFMVFCTGHLVYMLVPGYGPYRHLAEQFRHPLEGGLFWSLVKATVEAGGAQKDIFPSLHTAAPTFFAIFSYMHRRAYPFRYTWPFMAFAATQIICATMFLRWHYLVDIVAGLTLATTSALVSYRVVRWEAARRKRIGVPPVFALLEYNLFRREDKADAQD